MLDSNAHGRVDDELAYTSIKHPRPLIALVTRIFEGNLSERMERAQETAPKLALVRGNWVPQPEVGSPLEILERCGPSHTGRKMCGVTKPVLIANSPRAKTTSSCGNQPVRNRWPENPIS